MTNFKYSLEFGTFTVTDPTFGAVGDGTTDDTAAIQSAIFKCMSVGGGVVYFPPRRENAAGTLPSYNITATLVDRQNVTLAANNGSNGIRLTLTPANPWIVTGTRMQVDLVGGVPAASGTWPVNLISNTPTQTVIDLVGPAWGGSVFTSGGVAAFSGNIRIRLQGSGCEDTSGSAITGNFAGYLINIPSQIAQATLQVVDGLLIQNFNASGNGLYIEGPEGVTVSNCVFTSGNIGCQIVSFGSNFCNNRVRNCTTGFISGQGTIYNNRFTKCGKGLWMAQYSPTASQALEVFGNSFEVNDGVGAAGIVVGDLNLANPGVGKLQFEGGVISSNSFESNTDAIRIESAVALSVIGNFITGTWLGNNNINSGINITGNANQCSFISNTISVPGVATAAVVIPNSTFSIFIANIANGATNSGHGSGVTWSMPTDNSAQFIGNNDPNNSHSSFPSETFNIVNRLENSFNNLPGQLNFPGTTPIVGSFYNINDSNTAVWGATVAGGGTNHVLARYNGTNWTVVGI